jgi:hypothetical protein
LLLGRCSRARRLAYTKTNTKTHTHTHTHAHTHTHTYTYTHTHTQTHMHTHTHIHTHTHTHTLTHAHIQTHTRVYTFIYTFACRPLRASGVTSRFLGVVGCAAACMVGELRDCQPPWHRVSLLATLWGLWLWWVWTKSCRTCPRTQDLIEALPLPCRSMRWRGPVSAGRWRGPLWHLTPMSPRPRSRVLRLPLPSLLPV